MQSLDKLKQVSWLAEKDDGSLRKTEYPRFDDFIIVKVVGGVDLPVIYSDKDKKFYGLYSYETEIIQKGYKLLIDLKKKDWVEVDIAASRKLQMIRNLV